MPTDKVIEKYTNLALADIASRVMKYKSRSYNRDLSQRERAISKVLYVELGSFYNSLRRSFINLRPSLAEKPNEYEFELLNQAKNIALMPDDDEIDKLIFSAYNQSRAEIEEARKSADSVLLKYMTENPEIATRVYKDSQKILEMAAKKARGNPALGGFTRAAIAKGYMPEVAKEVARENLETLEAKRAGEAIARSPEYKKAIAAELAKDKGSDIDWIAMLTPSSEEIVNKATIAEVEDDFSSFDDPELLEGE